MAGIIFILAIDCLYGDLSEIGIAFAGLVFAVIGRILTHYRGGNHFHLAEALLSFVTFSRRLEAILGTSANFLAIWRP